MDTFSFLTPTCYKFLRSIFPSLPIDCGKMNKKQQLHMYRRVDKKLLTLSMLKNKSSNTNVSLSYNMLFYNLNDKEFEILATKMNINSRIFKGPENIS